MADEKPRVTIYSDGGCRPNPGPGGWAAVLLCNGREPEEISGADPEATNNRMEIRAAIEGLRNVERPSVVELHTDSQYLKKGITSWIEGWKRRGWRTAQGSPVQNRDLWQELEVELERHDVHWKWVKGHAGNRWNERVDELASAAIPREVGLVDDPDAVHLVLGVAYSGKSRNGAWAVLLRHRDHEKDLHGVVEGTTPNALHIISAVRGLEVLKRSVRIHLYTASDYLKDGATAWIRGWKSRGWRTRDGKPVSNQSLWLELEKSLSRHQVEWHVLKSDDDLEELEGVKRAAKHALVEG